MNTRWWFLVCSTLFLFVSYDNGLKANETTTDASPTPIYEGRIALVGKLDEPDGLCIDVPGPPFRLMLDRPAWVHTCKPGDISDMIFSFDSASTGPIMSKLTDPAICITASDLTVGSKLFFVECDASSEKQKFSYLENGQLQLTATSDEDSPLCLAVQTAASVPFGEPPNNDDPQGHSMVVNLERSHVARPMELRDCATAPLEVSQWEAYYERPLNPFDP